MRIGFSELNASQRYHIMTQVIVPRPIAWVLSDNGLEGDSAYNLAPFSYFNAISSDPALVMISTSHKPSGEWKDTRLNILERKQLVIHIPSVSNMQAVSDSAATLVHGESEIAAGNLPLTKEEGWHLPRLSDAKIALACHYYDHKEFGPNKQAVIFCEIEDVYVDDEAFSEDQKGRAVIDASKVDPLSRLGANAYADFGNVITLARPK
ncbi:MAG: flavin reductase family protein [Agarilytica sp.]